MRAPPRPGSRTIKACRFPKTPFPAPPNSSSSAQTMNGTTESTTRFVSQHLLTAFIPRRIDRTLERVSEPRKLPLVLSRDAVARLPSATTCPTHCCPLYTDRPHTQHSTP